MCSVFPTNAKGERYVREEFAQFVVVGAVTRAQTGVGSQCTAGPVR